MGMEQVISELNRIKSKGLIADYAIGGAIAADIYIEPKSTLDIDVFVLLGSSGAIDDMGPVWADLVANGAKWDEQYLVIGGWPVQLLGQGSPLDQDAVLNAVDHSFGRQVGRVLTAHHVAATSLALLRPDKDPGRLMALLQSPRLDRAALMDLIERFGLRAKWDAFQTFLTTNARK